MRMASGHRATLAATRSAANPNAAAGTNSAIRTAITTGVAFDIRTIEQQAGLVEFSARQGHTNLVIVAVRVLALALVIAQVVSGGECVFDSNFVHEIQLASAGFIVHFEALGDISFKCLSSPSARPPELPQAARTQAQMTR